MTGSSLAFVRQFRAEIIAEWRRGARGMAVATGMSPLALIDHLPELLEEIAVAADVLRRDSHTEPPTFQAREHALERLRAGFDLGSVIHELCLLRSAILASWEREDGRWGRGLERYFHLAIDRTIAVTVDCFVASRERTIEALDRLAQAARESTNLDQLLARIVAIVGVEVPASAVATIHLVERGELRVRARAGAAIDGARPRLFELIESLAAHVVSMRQALPRAVAAAGGEQATVRALYGAPIAIEESVVGALVVGTGDVRIADDDRRLVEAIASHASTPIAHHRAAVPHVHAHGP